MIITKERIEQEKINLGINTKQDALELIIDIADDYDNCRTADQLKELVGEIEMIAKIGYSIKENDNVKKEES